MERGHKMAAHFGDEDRQRQERRDQEGAPVGRDLVAVASAPGSGRDGVQRDDRVPRASMCRASASNPPSGAP
jgi:hypothetical protein